MLTKSRRVYKNNGKNEDIIKKYISDWEGDENL